MDHSNWNIVYAYTRAQALADGVLVDVTEEAKQFGYKVPVAVTANLFNLYVRASEGMITVSGHSCIRTSGGILWITSVFTSGLVEHPPTISRHNTSGPNFEHLILHGLPDGLAGGSPQLGNGGSVFIPPGDGPLVDGHASSQDFKGFGIFGVDGLGRGKTLARGG